MKSARSQRLQGALVIGEIAIAFVLLVGAGVMVRSLFHLQNTDRGFDPARVLTMEIAPPQTRYPEGADVVAFFGELIDRLSHQPGVEAAAAGNSQPGTGWTFLPQIEGREENRENKARFLLITPDYFQTLGIPLLKGRAFTPDDRLGQRPVMIINKIAADRLFPGEEPIGRRLSFNGREDLHEVVGVVGNVANPREEAPSSACYIPLYQQPVTMRSVGQNSVAVFLRTHGDPLELVAPLRRAIGSLDSDLPISNIQSMDQHLAQTIFRPRLNAALLAGFAALALFLASVGIFSLVAFNVNQRLPEIGIRMALGAERPRVLRLVMKRGLVLALPGIGIGLGAGLALSRFLESLVVGVSPLDPWTYVVVSLLLLGVVMLTCLVPAYRASRLDPAVTLRTE